LLALLDGANYPGQLAAQLGLSRSNVSNHLSCLRGCGLVVATYQGRQVHYALADAHLAAALSELVKVVLAPSNSSALAVDQAQACIDDQTTQVDAR
jgi:DNA-binding transcriptional ArsR family regulator